jgi:hypothetical protein
MENLADLQGDLQHFGMRRGLASVGLTILAAANWETPESQTLDVKVVDTTYRLRGLTDWHRESIIKLFSEKNPALKKEWGFGSLLNYRHIRNNPNAADAENSWKPDIVTDCAGNYYCVVDPTTFVPEPMSSFIMLYCLGMMARYHADIWINALDNNVPLAELTDTLLHSFYRRFPMLLLDQLTGIVHRITAS